MGKRHHFHRLASSIAGILILITLAFAPPGIASAQTRIISLSGDLDFGRIPFGTSAQRTLTISNAGDSVLTVSNLLFPPVPALSQSSFQGNWSGTIQPGGSQDVIMTFTPAQTLVNGSHDLDFQGYLQIDSDATGGPNSIWMTGVGTWPPATRSLSLASNLDFGTVPIGSSAELFLPLTNNGDMPLTVSNITFPAGFSSYFLPVTIAAGSATSVLVTFSPSTITNYGGIATVNSDTTDPIFIVVTYGGNTTNSLLGWAQFAVSGTGSYPVGKFAGLFMPTNNAAFDNSGYFTANCTAKGKLNATITLAGKRYPFSAQLSPSGAASVSIARKHLPNLNVSLQFSANGIQLSPNFAAVWTGTVDDGTWTAELNVQNADLVAKNALRSVGAGKYTFNITGSTNAFVAPTTPGTGSIAVKISGATHVTGTLGDGTRYSQQTILDSTHLPFYASLYGNRGAILGWISFERGVSQPPPQIIPFTVASPTYQIHGTLNWFKPAGIDPDYPDGFSFQTTVTGSTP
jgi:hypothetical protein